MTHEELEKALETGCPVVADVKISFTREKIHFRCVNAILYRRNPDGSTIVTAELMDEKANSVIVIDPKFVHKIFED